MNLSTDKTDRKERPIARGVLDYFPNAIAEVARVSFVGNQQHNPGEPMHWAKHKSTDHADCIGRHLIERGTIDTDGLRHSAKIAWRALALLQIEIEGDRNHNMEPYGDERAEALAAQVPQDSAWQPKGHDMGYPVASNPADSECATTLRDETDPHATRGRSESAELHAQRDELRGRLVLEYHCPPRVAREIAGGTTFSYRRPPGARTPFAYVAGPMRGLPGFNFAAFDKARDQLVAEGFNVISPADIDRAAGDEQTDDQASFFLRDMFCLYFLKRQGDDRNKVHVLDGWQKSRGAAGEFFGGRWLDLKFSNPRLDEYPSETALHDFALRNSMARA